MDALHGEAGRSGEAARLPIAGWGDYGVRGKGTLQIGVREGASFEALVWCTEKPIEPAGSVSPEPNDPTIPPRKGDPPQRCLAGPVLDPSRDIARSTRRILRPTPGSSSVCLEAIGVLEPGSTRCSRLARFRLRRHRLRFRRSWWARTLPRARCQGSDFAPVLDPQDPVVPLPGSGCRKRVVA